MVCVHVDWVEKQSVLYFPLLSRMRLCYFPLKALRTCIPQSPSIKSALDPADVPRELQREEIWVTKHLGSEFWEAFPHGKVLWEESGG